MLLLACVGPTLGAETAREILDRRKALDDDERHWTDRRERLAFRTSTREQVFDFAEKRFPGDERKSTLVFVSPAVMRGTSVLSFSHRGREGEHWIQLSARERAPRRVSSSRREPFWGTDLTYLDLDVLAEMVSWTEVDAVSRLDGEEPVDGVPCHVIELQPERADIGYRRLRLWLGKADLVLRRLELFEDAPDPVRRLEQRDVRTIGRIPVAHRMTVVTLPARSQTDVVVSDVRFDQGIPDDAFTQAALARGPD